MSEPQTPQWLTSSRTSSGAELGDRVLLDLDPPITLVDRRPHGLGHVSPHATRALPKPDTSVNSIPEPFRRRVRSALHGALTDAEIEGLVRGSSSVVEGVGAGERPEVVEVRAGRGDDGMPAGGDALDAAVAHDDRALVGVGLGAHLQPEAVGGSNR